MGWINIVGILLFVMLLGIGGHVHVVRSVSSGNNNVYVGGFVRRKESHFLLHGSPFVFNGFNAYWMMDVASASESDGRSKVTQVFRQASATGLTVCRTWAFSDGGDRALQISPGVYDERVFQGLDFVICEAKKYGIRVILSFVNNYKDYGGKAQYVEWAKRAGAQVVNGDDDFYTNPTIKYYYKNHVRKVVTRLNTISRVTYRDDPTIMAWELMNEPRCQSDDSGTTLNGWVEEMASFVKSMDKNHLLEIGMEGFYGETMPQRKQWVNPAGNYQVGTDFITNNLVTEIDFATIHAYPDIWLSPETTQHQQMGFMERWMRNHCQDATNILNKPLVIAEFGKSTSHSPTTSTSSTTKDDETETETETEIRERDLYISNIYRDIYRFVAAAGGGGSMSGSLVWQLMAQGMEEYHDGYQIILSHSPSTARIISNHSHAINALMPMPHHHHHHATKLVSI